MPERARILVVDDDVALAKMCVKLLESQQYDADAVTAGRDALERLKQTRYQIILADLVMPDMDGIQLLKHVKQIDPAIDVIVMTSYGTIDNAVEAMKQGAADYVTKPFKVAHLTLIIERLLHAQNLRDEVERLQHELETRYRFEEIIGRNAQMQRIYDLIATVSETDANILVQGETGTGKELVARAVHYNSTRRDKPFVKVDCASLTETLLESELFGHVTGAFTGATRDRDGRFLKAHTGTLFLDEISNVSPAVQAKLLRVIQESRFEAVGSDETVEVDVRLIAATNENIDLAADEGRFRRDLFYRLNVVGIVIPPLRDRKDDIPLLATHFLVEHRKRLGRDVDGIAGAALQKLMAYDWPGNVRELENLMERAVILCRGEQIEPGDVPLPGEQLAVSTRPDSDATLQSALAEAEKRIITDALRRADGDREAAAEQLGISRASIYGKIRKHNIAE